MRKRLKAIPAGIIILIGAITPAGFHCATLTIDDRISRALLHHNQRIIGIAFTRDSSRFYTTSEEGIVILRNSKGKHLKTLTGYYENQILLDVSPDGSFILTGLDRNRYGWSRARGENRQGASLWHLEKGLLGHLPDMKAAKFLNDREFIAWHQTSLTLYRASDQSVVRHLPLDFSDEVFFGNRGSFAVTGRNRTLNLYNSIDAKPTRLPAPKGAFSKVVFSNDDEFISSWLWVTGPNYLVTASIRAWRKNGTPVANFWHPDIRYGSFFINDQCNRFYLRACYGMNVFDVQGNIIETYRTDIGDCKADDIMGTDDYVIMSGDGKNVAALLKDRLLFFSSSGLVKTIDQPNRGVIDLAESPDGRFIVLGMASGALRIWSTSGKLIRHIEGGNCPFPADCMGIADRTLKLVDGNAKMGVTGWIDGNTFQVSGLGLPGDHASKKERIKSAREAAFKHGIKRTFDQFNSIRFSGVGKGDFASTGVAYLKEYLANKFDKDFSVVYEWYDEYDVCHIIMRLKHPYLRDKIEFKKW